LLSVSALSSLPSLSSTAPAAIAIPAIEPLAAIDVFLDPVVVVPPPKFWFAVSSPIETATVKPPIEGEVYLIPMPSSVSPSLYDVVLFNLLFDQTAVAPAGILSIPSTAEEWI
jgi:hypothetical protein